MISVSTDSLLRGIGCNMIAKSPSKLFPEECLLKLSTQALLDVKTMTLVVGALKSHSELFHPEFLLKKIKTTDNDTNVIGALLTKTNDRRFIKTIEHCRKLNYKSITPAKTLRFSLKIGQTKADRDFASFGIQISELTAAEEKKISNINFLAKTNVFFRNRLIYGCNWRADIISAIECGSKNPTEIKKRLDCSYETAHRIFNDYQIIKNIHAA